MCILPANFRHSVISNVRWLLTFCNLTFGYLMFSYSMFGNLIFSNSKFSNLRFTNCVFILPVNLFVLHSPLSAWPFCLVFQYINLVNHSFNGRFLIFRIKRIFSVRPDQAVAKPIACKLRTGFTVHVFSSTRVKLMFAYLWQSAWDACFCYCMYCEDAPFCLEHYLNQKLVVSLRSVRSKEYI
jgi:hypothetical protein